MIYPILRVLGAIAVGAVVLYLTTPFLTEALYGALRAAG